MDEIGTPYKKAVSMILRSIINLEDKYVLDKQYVRWGKVERDLWRLEEHYLATEFSPPDNAGCICDPYYTQLGIHSSLCPLYKFGGYP